MKLFRRRRRPGPPSFDVLLTPEARRRIADYTIVGFLTARIAEIQHIDLDGAERCLEVIDAACDRIATGPINAEFYLRGAIKDMDLLKRLAKNWADHPDYRPEWSR